jgi:hypothetical protein
MPAPDSESEVTSRSDFHRFFSMTDRFHAELATVTEALVPIHVTATTPPDQDATGNTDVEAIAFVVLMEAASSAVEDLKSLMHEAKAINEVKARLRCPAPVDSRARATPPLDFESLVHLSLAVYAKQAEQEAREALDSISEMGEMESLCLQMTMDRLSKMMSTLSNVLKRIADTQAQLIQNLK